jgi:hypothetical protein
MLSGVDLSGIISAVAASVAAVLAATGLYVGGRREDTKWVRDAMVDDLVSFLDLSYRAADSVRAAIRAIVAGEAADSPDIDRRRMEAGLALEQMAAIQTRLRLLTTPRMVEAAHALRVEVRAYKRVLDADPATIGELADPARARLMALRSRFVVAAKTAISLPRSGLRMPADLST